MSGHAPLVPRQKQKVDSLNTLLEHNLPVPPQLLIDIIYLRIQKLLNCFTRPSLNQQYLAFDRANEHQYTRMEMYISIILTIITAYEGVQFSFV